MIVTVKALFSRKSKIGSRIITLGTKHLASKEMACSHAAVLINDRFVFESTLDKGVHVSSYNSWLKENIQVDSVLISLMDYKELAYLYRSINGKKYDWMGLCYLALNIVPSYFGKDIPAVNKWQSKDKYFCTEVLGYLLYKDYSMTTPNQILKQLRSAK